MVRLRMTRNQPPDVDIVSAMVAEYSESLFRMVYKVIGNRDEAMDIVQDVFVQVLRIIADIAPDKRKPYLFSAAYNMALNARRDRGRRATVHQVLAAEHHADTRHPPDTDMASDLNAEHLQQAIAALADRQKQAVMLRFFADLNLREIAETMGIAIGSVKNHLCRGLQNLAGILTQPAGKE